VSESLSTVLAAWASRTGFDQLPDDVVQATKLRILDTIGLCLAGAETRFGRSVLEATVASSPPGPCRALATGERLGAGAAAFVNGARAQALEFDDTHNASIVHMSGPAVATGLALAELLQVSGRALIAAIAVGNEVSCRAGSVALGQFHKRGFHPTGLFTPFGVAHLAGKLLDLPVEALARATGIVGSFASGLLQCWVDGTQAKFLHSGWAAQAGLTAAFLARSGTTGPAEVFEGRFGFFASHVQDPAAPRHLERIVDRLDEHWDSRGASFKPYPAAHVLHPYIDAVLRLRSAHDIEPADVLRIECPVDPVIVPIVCEPTSEKWAPASDSHGRVSLQYTLAEALFHGRLGRTAYAEDSLRHSGILSLARRVHYRPDPAFGGHGYFTGAVEVTLKDGRTFRDVEEFNRGSAENPMSDADLRAKFDENARGFLAAPARARLYDAILELDALPDARRLVDLTMP
jgi:2-methylcitrate dehydratase PrpD